MAELDKTVKADKETIEARLSDLAKLAEQIRALTALRDELEKQAQDAAARATTEQQRRAAVEAQLADEKKLGDSARAQIALLNQQVEQLKAQLAAVAQALDLRRTQGQRQGHADRQSRPAAERGAGRQGGGVAALSQRVLRQAARGAGEPARASRSSATASCSRARCCSRSAAPT